MNSQQQLQHLYWRAGFGPRPEDIAAHPSPAKALRQLLREAGSYTPIEGPAFHYADPLGAVMAVPPAALATAAPLAPDTLPLLSPRTAALPPGRPVGSAPPPPCCAAATSHPSSASCKMRASAMPSRP
jgi:hypothetical protein